MIREGNFKKINVMVMRKHALPAVRKCAGTSCSNREGLCSVSLSSLEKLASVSSVK